MRHKNNFIPTIREQKSVLVFLTELICDGYNHSTIVKACSAISNVLLCTNWNISNDPLISRFMRGTFNVQRPLPKHSAFWNVSPTYFKTFIKLIQKRVHKVVTLLCLTSFGREHTISLIRKSNVHFLANKSASIFIYDDLKVKRPPTASFYSGISALQSRQVLIRCPQPQALFTSYQIFTCFVTRLIVYQLLSAS